MLDWEVHPAGLEELILRLAKEYGAEKIYITENGSAWVDQPDASSTSTTPSEPLTWKGIWPPASAQSNRAPRWPATSPGP